MPGDNLDMAAVVAAIQNENVTVAKLEDDLHRARCRVRELENELAKSVALEEKFQEVIDSAVTFDGYQAAAMETARFDVVGHPAVKDLLSCFAHTGRIAEIVKKAYRDRKGVFSKEDSDEIFISGAYIQELAKAASGCCEHAFDYKGSQVIYPLLGLVGETGEVADKIGKIYAHDYQMRKIHKSEMRDLIWELGDVLWYLAALAHTLGVDLSEVARLNIEKLRSRRARSVIHGDGDNR